MESEPQELAEANRISPPTGKMIVSVVIDIMYNRLPWQLQDAAVEMCDQRADPQKTVANSPQVGENVLQICENLRDFLVLRCRKFVWSRNRSPTLDLVAISVEEEEVIICALSRAEPALQYRAPGRSPFSMFPCVTRSTASCVAIAR